ncbi:MAG TPA: hypothetical protein VKA21_06290 [Candidatus Binatia bacterium]|nr:hypothetical protein [Candidatus Binatia bacterium]
MLALARAASGSNHLIAIEEVLGSWQGDDTVQFVELRLLADGQRFLTAGGGTVLVFDDATGAAETRKFFSFTRDVTAGTTNARILIGTERLAAVSGVVPDFVLPPGMLGRRSGRVCYVVNPPQAPGEPTGVRDCVAYGTFTGDNGSFGPATPLTPDNRALQRVASTGRNTDDWSATLAPTPQNNAGDAATLATLCGDGLVSQGEDCDGNALGGATCASLGFATGTLGCTQCHFDTTRCSFCGNGAINEKEECDGADFGGRTCESLGFVGGSLTCSETCRVATRSCSPTFFVPGGGPRGPECLAEWRVTNRAGRPGIDGKARPKQRCNDGDDGCDADLVSGTCTFTVGLCFDRDDARLANGSTPCRRTAIESWTLLSPPAGGAGDPLLAAVTTLGPSTPSDGTVTFAPPLETAEHCTGDVALTVPTRGRRPGVLRLRARTAGSGGRPRDVDALKLVCVP